MANDSDIYMMVAGYVGILPATPAIKGLTASQMVAINEGRKQIALRRAQPIAAKALKDKKPVAEAVNAFLATFEPDENTEFQTVGSKRLELAKDYLRQLFTKAGQPTDDATLEKNAPKALTSEKHGPNIAALFDAWLASYTPPTKRAAKTEGEAGTDVDLDAID